MISGESEDNFWGNGIE